VGGPLKVRRNQPCQRVLWPGSCTLALGIGCDGLKLSPNARHRLPVGGLGSLATAKLFLGRKERFPVGLQGGDGPLALLLGQFVLCA
jgi:hypothetical protein